MKNDRRLVVSVHLLQRSLAVHVDMADVKPLKKTFAAVLAAPVPPAGSALI
jgi:hypothetical protein